LEPGITFAFPKFEYPAQTRVGEMFTTVGDVSSVAKQLWPEAVVINVGLAPRSASSDKKMYRVSALNKDNRLLGRVDSQSLGELKRILDARYATSVNTMPDFTERSLYDAGVLNAGTRLQ